MRRTVLILGFLGITTAIALAAGLQPLDVKTGLWQVTETVTWTGYPPQFGAAMGNARTHSHEMCVRTPDLSTNPWGQGSGEKCTWTVLSSTGTDMEVRGTSCEMGSEYGMTAEVHGRIHVLDAKDGTGSFDIVMTGNGHTINGHASYAGKWVGSSCPTE
jgi:Protein of unknown function (DUF3617)